MNTEYYIISNIFFGGSISNETIIEYNDFIEDVILENFSFRMFKECHNFHEFEHINEIDGQYYYPREYLPSYIDWTCTNYKINFSQPWSDVYALPSLYFIIENFFSSRNIPIFGNVICINKDTNEVIFYNIKTLEFKYHINKSIDLTKHWSECRKFHNQNEQNTNEFLNLMIDVFGENATISHSDINIFKNTYTHLI